MNARTKLFFLGSALLLLFMVLAVSAPADNVAAATRTVHANRPTFEGALTPGTAITDDYGAASGYPAGFNIYDNATMSAIFGETDYFTTGFSNWNFHLSDDRYCAGCNGSFRLIFTSTSVTVGGIGVYGVGVDIQGNSSSLPYWAYVTYGDGTTEDFPLPAGNSFFGITSSDLIVSIHMGLQGGLSTTSGSITLDNLTIGAGEAGQPTPPPSGAVSDLSITKTVSPNPLVAGMPGSYTIVSTNLGPDPAENVTITEFDVSGVELQDVSCPGGTIDIQADRIVCTWAGPTDVGQSRTMVLSGRVCPELLCGTTITNRAVTSADFGEGGEPTVKLYGTMGYGWGQTSTLYELNPDSGEIIREIGPVGYLCNGLDWDPTTNTLYCGTSYTDPNFNGLIEIDVNTGAGTPVGVNGWGQGGVAVTNITLNSTGQMYGWSEWCDCLVSIDKNTGIATDVGPSIGSLQNGLSFNSSDRLYMINYGGTIYEIDPGIGSTNIGSFGQTAHHGDFHPTSDLYYGLDSTGSPRTLLRCDLTQQSCEPAANVQDMHTLAFAVEGGMSVLAGTTTMYGTMGYGYEQTSTLYELDPDTGAVLAEIGPVGHTVNGLDSDPTSGKLYASTSVHDPVFNGLIEIDVNTGAGTPVGAAGWGQGGVPVTNITLNSAGEMYGWSEWCDCLVRIDKNAGTFTQVGSGVGSYENGLSFNSLDDLYMVNGGGPFYSVDTGTGVATYVGDVGQSAHHGDFHPVTDLYYGLTWTYGDPRTVLRCDLDQQNCEPAAEVEDMHTLAFAFEEDGGGGAYDPNLANNTVTLETPVETQSNLSITKRDSPDPVIAGQTLTYDLTVRNTGPSNADRVVVTDELPMYATFLSATSTPPGVTCSAVGKTVTCELGTLGAPNQCETTFPEEYLISMQVLISDLAPSSVAPCDGEPLFNEASVASANCRPDTGTLSASALTDVLAGADVLLDPPIVEPQDECVGPGAYIKVTQRFSNTGPEAYTIQRDNFGPEFSAGMPAAVVGVPSSCVVLEGTGNCQINAGQVYWNGEIPVGQAVVLEYKVRVRGGIEFGSEICFGATVNYDECNTLVNTASRELDEDVCILADCESLIDPNTQLGMQVHLPILTFLGQDDCEVWIEVQNIGPADVKAVLVTWGEAGFCPPQAAGPLKVECTGLLKPGTTWNMLGDQIPDGSKSGMLFKFSTKQLSDYGLDEIFGFDDIFADLMCETLFFGVVGDADDWRRFKKAYNEGGTFAGIPMDLASGAEDGGILAVDVLRTCDADKTPGAKVTSKYNGIAGSHLGTYDQVYGGYSYYVPMVYAQRDGMNTWVYIQNGGLECSSVEIWLKAQDDCLRSQICEASALAPGETLQFDPNTCVGPGWVGSLWLRSSQPMGVAVDVFGNDVLMTYVGEPSEINYTFDPEQADVSPGNQVAFGPLVYSEYQGWDSAVQVQNLSPVVTAKVKVYFLDRGGGVITTLVDWICPRGAQTFFLPVVADLPGNWVGSVRVESQEILVPGGPAVYPPNIVAVAALVKYSDAVRTETREAMAYNLLPEHKVFDWQLGGMGAGGLEGGVGLIAIPSLIKDLDGTGVASELAITNVVPKPGFTDFVIYIYDQNGLLDYVCEKLNEKQVEYIELSSWGYINEGFKGSAIISAFFWEHDVFGDDGFFLRNLVGLGAVSVERSRTKLGMDIPGDESAGSRGIPFRQSDIEGAEFKFNFLGESPQCPGLFGSRPEPGACPSSLTVKCTNCPVTLPDLVGGTGEITGVNVPSGCRVTDVDMLVDLTHTYDGDLIATLSSDALQSVPMWNGICGGSDNIQAILDDEAGTPIGTVCPPSGFERYTTAPPGGMTMFEGLNPNGTWQLDIQDQFGGDQGTLNNWELTFTIK